MTASRLLAAGLAAIGLVAGGVLVLGDGSGTAASAPPPGCPVLRVSALGHGVSTVYRVDLGTGGMTRLRTLDRRVDAIGYHRGQGVAYGLAGRGSPGAHHDRARVVRLAANGTLTDLGPVRGREDLSGASAGAVAGDLLYVREGRELHGVDVNPASAKFLTVVRSVRLWPSELAHTVDDFDYRPADGLLYGVNTLVPFQGRVTRIDPRTGRVGHANVPKLPGGRTYGSVAFGPDGALYAASNRTHHHPWHDHGTPSRSRLIRVALAPGAVPVEIAAWPVANHTDMTGCLPVPPPPTTTPPPPPPSTTVPPPPPAPPTPPPPAPEPPEPPAVVPPVVPPAVPPAVPPVVPPTVPPVVPPVVPPAVPPGPPALPPPPPVQQPNPVPTPQLVRQSKRPPSSSATPDNATEEKRRWGLTALVLILGASAAASGARRHR
ncbi:DUF6923 family protein [Actinokineospora sp. 24-640]